jgi:hypothetical protein
MSIGKYLEAPDRAIEIDKRKSDGSQVNNGPAAQLAHRVEIKHGETPFKAAGQRRSVEANVEQRFERRLGRVSVRNLPIEKKRAIFTRDTAR